MIPREAIWVALGGTSVWVGVGGLGGAGVRGGVMVGVEVGVQRGGSTTGVAALVAPLTPLANGTVGLGIAAAGSALDSEHTSPIAPATRAHPNTAASATASRDCRVGCFPG